MSDVARLRAARALARGATQAQAAREAGVDRSSITHWKKEASFQDLILKANDPEPEPETPDQAARQGLTARVEAALQVIDKGLAGDPDVSPAMGRLALDVIKAAKTFEPQAGAEEGPSTLTALIARLDASDEAAGS